MLHEGLAPPPRVALTRHVRQALQRYWPTGDSALDRLAVAKQNSLTTIRPLKLVQVQLPEWARGCGVEGYLAVPSEACANAELPQWSEVDWWLAAFLMLEGWHERAFENTHGPIHSYSARLKAWDEGIWARAWVNRIGLFLRAWAANEAGQDEATLFGPMPQPEIILTHDVDAVAKTWSIRLKQSAFLGYNAVRFAAKARPRMALSRFRQAYKFLFSASDWWMLDAVIDAERRAGVRSLFNFYADDRPKSLLRWIYDPGYDICSPRVREFLVRLTDGGWKVGLHPSHDSWRSADLVSQQRQCLQSCVTTPVKSCRQHWLRFSWHETWAAQAAAGLALDTTLMFNDRPGLRSAAALSWTPWNSVNGCAHRLSVLPTLMMDSHFYDYAPMSAEDRRIAVRYWLDEVTAVGGQVAILWHPHTLAGDYGWIDGFRELLADLQERSLCAGP